MSTSVRVFSVASSWMMTNVSFKTENLYEEKGEDCCVWHLWNWWKW